MILDMNETFDEDPEFIKFIAAQEGKSKATLKQYKSNYIKLRRTLQKPISETAEKTAIDAINAAFDNPNSQAALFNIVLLVRKCYDMPYDLVVEQRTKNKETIDDTLRQVNQYMVLPSIQEYDDYIEDLYQKEDYLPYVINHLIRHHYVRNKDLMFQWVLTQKETQDTSKNYMLYERKKNQITWVRNNYKTAGKYGQKKIVIDNERLQMALKKCQSRGLFPIAQSDDLIGYHIQKHTFNKLGEGACMKIIVNHYKHDINMLKLISKSRGTDLPTLLTNYNIVYTD